MTDAPGPSAHAAGAPDGAASVPPAWRTRRIVRAYLAEREIVSAASDGDGSSPDDGLLLVLGRPVEGDDDRLVGIGAPRAVARLVDAFAGSRSRAARGPVGWMSVPRGTLVGARTQEALGLEHFSEWDWLSCDTAAAADPASVAVRLDPVSDADAISACLAVANPSSSAHPGGPHEAAWFGVRDGDRLVGVFGAARHDLPDVDGARGEFMWHLHGLGVLPEARGCGLGTVLTAAATAAGQAAGAAWVSLSMYADNQHARRVYEGLGYRVDGAFTSYGPPGATAPPA